MSNKKVEVTEIPDQRTFANSLVESFLIEEGIALQLNEGEEFIDVLLTIPDLHLEFTLWLCDFIRQGSFEDLASPTGVVLN